MANDPRKLGHRIAASLVGKVWKNPKEFWHDIFHHWTEHVRAYMDLWEVVRPVHTGALSYVIPDEDVFLFVDTVVAGGPYTVYLPADPLEGTYIVIKDAGGAAGVGNEIYINRNGNLIDGGAVVDAIDTAYGNATYVFDGTQWMRLMEGAGGGGGGPAGTEPVTEYFDLVGPADKVHVLASLPVSNVRCALNGIGLREGLSYDFTVSGQTVTLTANQGVKAGDWLEAVYYV